MAVLRGKAPQKNYFVKGDVTVCKLYDSNFRQEDKAELNHGKAEIMEIKLNKITVRELVAGYRNEGPVEGEGGDVVGYSGRLNIRPPFQRGFIYNEKQKRAVIETVLNKFPLSVMYWAVGEDGNYEVIDGQQRLITIALYWKKQFAIKDRHGRDKYFHSLSDAEQEKFLDYELMVYFCKGNHNEKMEWFERINIAGVALSAQELLNAVYAGTWVTDAREWFSHQGCQAHERGKHLLAGNMKRQDYLETVIKWISGGEIKDYMSRHQHEKSAQPLWDYFYSIIDWVDETFGKRRPAIMRGVDWGSLHRDHNDRKFDREANEAEVSRLLQDEEVGDKKGIFAYILTREEKHLNLRRFEKRQKLTAYERQNGKCAACSKEFAFEEMHGDHIRAVDERRKNY